MINIGKYVYARCKKLVGERCYPIVAEATTKKPFICYSRTSALPETTKDAMMFDLDSTIQVNIVSDSYDESVELLEGVVSQLHDFEGTVAGINVLDSKITQVAEFYMNDAYVQQVTLRVTAAEA